MLRGNISNRNVTTKVAQLHYFLSQNVGGAKDIMSKSWGDMFPPQTRSLADVQFAVMYIGVTESRQRTRATVQPLWE